MLIDYCVTSLMKNCMLAFDMCIQREKKCKGLEIVQILAKYHREYLLEPITLHNFTLSILEEVCGFVID